MSTGTTPQNRSITSHVSTGGRVLLSGAVVMILGAIVRGITDTDLDAALTSQDIAGYLADAASTQAALVLNLSLWIVGASLLGLGGYLLSQHDESIPTLMGRFAYLVGPALAITAFVVWMALIRMAGTGVDLVVADALGWVASRVDWIATVFLVGFGPLLLSLGARRSWVPGWLFGLGILAATAGVLTVVAMYVGALHTFGFAIVPVGLAWTIAASIVALRVR